MGADRDSRAVLTRLASPRFFDAVRARLMDRFALTQYVAEDVTSDAIEWAWQHLDAYDARGLSLHNWVFQRAVWRALDYFKLPRSKFEQDAADVTEVLPTPDKSIEMIASERELEEHVLAMLAETPQLLRLYKIRRAWNLSSKEIAASLGVTVKDVKNLYEQLARALKRINALLEAGVTEQ